MKMFSERDSKEAGFLLSALTEENRFQDTDAFISWFQSRGRLSSFSVEQIPFDALDQWSFDETSQNIVHATGKFFTIEGLSVSTTFGTVREWDQPIIVQREIGILGLITKEFEGIPYFLMQAKMEPGNMNIVQLSPTVQATKSNYTRVHKGKAPSYLEYFLDRTRSLCLVDQLQTEQGARFLRKRNRNMIVEVVEDIELYDKYCWLTLAQIKELLKIDNFVNMDARSVLSCIPFVDSRSDTFDKIGLLKHSINDFSRDLLISMGEYKRACNSLDEILSWFTELKTKYEIDVKRIHLNKVSRWRQTDREIKHDTGSFFSVIAVSVQGGNREVGSWAQPMFKSTSKGLQGFVTKRINNILHFLVQGKVEPGNIDIVDMAPTVSCSEVESKILHKDKPPFLDILMNASPEQIRYSGIQSEEGGRFYHVQNRNMVIELDEDMSLEMPLNYIWMTLGQMMELMKHGYFNIEGRSVISCLSLL